MAGVLKKVRNRIANAGVRKAGRRVKEARDNLVERSVEANGYIAARLDAEQNVARAFSVKEPILQRIEARRFLRIDKLKSHHEGVLAKAEDRHQIALDSLSRAQLYRKRGWRGLFRLAMASRLARAKLALKKRKNAVVNKSQLRRSK